jgi:hypothetical protein
LYVLEHDRVRVNPRRQKQQGARSSFLPISLDWVPLTFAFGSVGLAVLGHGLPCLNRAFCPEFIRPNSFVQELAGSFQKLLSAEGLLDECTSRFFEELFRQGS